MKFTQTSIVKAQYFLLFLAVLSYIAAIVIFLAVISNNRQANINRQNTTNEYIKCVLLLRYDHPEITPQSPRADVEQALDNCAKGS